jgi:hypothetical protein
MPWKGVTMTGQRQRFIEDDQLNKTPLPNWQNDSASPGR